MPKSNQPTHPSCRVLSTFVALFVAITPACSFAKTSTTTAEAKSDNGLALNIDGKVNSLGNMPPMGWSDARYLCYSWIYPGHGV